MYCAFCACAIVVPAKNAATNKPKLIPFIASFPPETMFENCPSFPWLRVFQASAERLPPASYRRRLRSCQETADRRSMRERPQPQLFLRNLPKSRQSMRLDDQEENDQRAERHQLEVGNR